MGTPALCRSIWSSCSRPATHLHVIVAAPGVARNPRAFGVVELRGIRPRRVVEFAHANDRLGRWQKIARIVANGGAVVGKVTHFSGVPRGHPIVEPVPIASR